MAGTGSYASAYHLGLLAEAESDLPGAIGHYATALQFKPDHRGALEYSGELYLMKGELPKAEERLATLAKVCGNCEEHQDLKGATERYRKAGKYVPE